VYVAYTIKLNKPRTLYITTYYAEDAIELSPNALPSTFTHELVRGEHSGRVRCSTYDIPLPEGHVFLCATRAI